MTNVLEFVTVNDGNTVRAMNGGRQLAVAEKLNDGLWFCQKQNCRIGDSPQDAIISALDICILASVESVEFTAHQYDNGMISYEDKPVVAGESWGG